MNQNGRVSVLTKDDVNLHRIFFNDGLEMENINQLGSITYHIWLMLVIQTIPGLKINGTNIILIFILHVWV